MANANRLIELFNEAKARPAGLERERFLAEACPDDPELKEQVLSLLQAHEGAGDFLKRTLVVYPTALVTEKPGDKIGRYKLLQVIGEGGCGIVYMAEQSEPVRRKVALKVIKLGMDTKQVVARFEAERQALALMDHPNIAKVFDAGATDAGRPYFVMELVRGIKITDYCDQNHLSTSGRLDLFIQVCQAIQHAHQKGIIHRDIKPSNVLVSQHDTVAVPKVIDFGIAKATSDQALTDKTLFTAFEQFMGTPAYMSSEQAQWSGLDIDTRTDIYSLGVLLYELLTGQTPFDAEHLLRSGLDEMRRIIREEEPPRPSTRLGTLGLAEATELSRKRQMKIPELAHGVRGDLDWIVMKCLEKDRTRRYETANGLAADLQRHLANEPVMARPPSTVYRFHKAFRRNKLAFSAAAAIGLVLVVGIMASTWQAIEASRARNAEKEQRLSAQSERNKARTAQKEAEHQTQRAQAALTRVEIERAESMFAADNSSRAMAHLARILRQQPTNGVVAERLMSALTYRNFCLPAAQPLQHRSPLVSSSNSTPETSSALGLFIRLGSIRAANFSPDGQRVVTASRDGTAQVWDSRTGLRVGEPLKHQAPVMCAQFNADGKRVVTASLDKTARIWDAMTGQAKTDSLRHEGGVLFAEFSADGRKVVTASQDKTVRLWDVESGQPLLDSLIHGGAVYFARFTSDGSRLFTASMDGRARVWNSETGEEVAAFPQFFLSDSALPFPQFGSDGRRLVTLNEYDTVIWDVPSRKRIGASMNPENAMHSAGLSSDGKLIATGSRDNTARVWDAGTGMPVTFPIKHENWVESVHFDAEGQRLVTGSRDNSARIWDAHTGVPLSEPLRLDSRVRFAHFSPDGHRLVTFSDLDAAWLWDVRAVQPFRARLRHKQAVRCAVFSPDGGRVATTSRDGTGRVWDARTGEPITDGFITGLGTENIQFSPDGQRLVSSRVWDSATGKPLTGPFQHTDVIWCTQFSPDGKRVVTASKDRTARISDSLTGHLLAVLRHADDVNCARFSPDGQRVATASYDGTARVWDAQTGRALTNPLQHDDCVHWVDFSPDGKRLATASKDKTVRLWDAYTGQMLMKPLTHTSELHLFHAVQFSPDGARVVAAAGSIAQLWDAHTGEPLVPPLKHDGRVNSVRFSPDGRRLVTTGYDACGRIWDVATGHVLSETLRHTGRVTYAEFSPDSRSVTTASADGTARIWEVGFAPLPIPNWLPELAEAVAGQKIDSRDISNVVPVEDLFRLKQRLSQSAGTGYYDSWAKWFFADRADRTLPAVSTNINTNKP